MMDYEVVDFKLYDEPKEAYSMFSGDKVEIIGEQTVRIEDGTTREHYLYNIVGYHPANGKSFVSLKCNLVLS